MTQELNYIVSRIFMSEVESRSLEQSQSAFEPIEELTKAIAEDINQKITEKIPENISDIPPELLPEVLPEIPSEKPAETLPEIYQVRLKTHEGKLHLLLPSEPRAKVSEPNSDLLPSFDWSELLSQLEQRLSSGERFWQPGTAVYLQASDRLLDSNQLQDISESLFPYGLQLVLVNTQRRQTAIAAATAGFSVEQEAVAPNLASKKPEQEIFDEPLYLKMTVRSGVEIKHSGSVIILGDVNAGGEVVADGDILVWGKLRGKAHAGAKGNNTARIMALLLDPTQIRIADHIARVDKPNKAYGAEIAFVSDQKICIVAVS
jgi:septum site-determining protein MinC